VCDRPTQLGLVRGALCHGRCHGLSSERPDARSLQSYPVVSVPALAGSQTSRAQPDASSDVSGFVWRTLREGGGCAFLLNEHAT
jgi:hypothetical protein